MLSGVVLLSLEVKAIHPPSGDQSSMLPGGEGRAVLLLPSPFMRQIRRLSLEPGAPKLAPPSGRLKTRLPLRACNPPPRRWSTSILVVSETYSWFLHRLGEEAARTFRGLLEELPRLRVLSTDDRHRHAVSSKLDSLRGTKLTYVDASSLVWLEQRRISRVWGTDHHLSIEGARVFPGSPAR